jgi:hypothetical protein
VQRWERRLFVSTLSPGIAPAQVNAARALRASGEALGGYRTRILYDHLVEDLSWAELGARRHLDPKTARRRAVACLDALACWRAGRPLPPPPVERFRNQPSSW